MRRRGRHAGFTLLEMLMAMAVFLTISGAILSGMATMQKNYRSNEIRTTMQQRLRAIVELMDQEVGQAGLQHSSIEGNGALTPAGSGITTATAPYTLAAAITAAGTQVVTLNSTVGLYTGEWLELDIGASEDPIQVTQVSGNTIKATFSSTHPQSAPLFPMGIFPHGIMGDVSTSQQLVFFGNIRGNTDSSGLGLYAVEYKCVGAGSTTSAPFHLTRTEWDLGTGLASSPAVMVDNASACYFCWPGITAGANAGLCPTGAAALDTVQIPNGTSTPQTTQMITQVGFTISVSQSAPASGAAPITVSKTFSNIEPRNILAADKIYQAACASASLTVSGCNALAATPSVSQPYVQYLYGELQPDPASLTALGSPW